MDTIKKFFANKKTYAMLAAFSMVGALKFSQIYVPPLIKNKLSYRFNYVIGGLVGKMVI